MEITTEPVEKWIPTEQDFIMDYGDHKFAFIEDENAQIYGYGHQDKQKFADAINLYDRLCDPDTEFQTDPSDVEHLYAYVTDHIECRFKWQTEPTEQTFPLTLTRNR